MHFARYDAPVAVRQTAERLSALPRTPTGEESGDLLRGIGMRAQACGSVELLQGAGSRSAFGPYTARVEMRCRSLHARSGPLPPCYNLRVL